MGWLGWTEKQTMRADVNAVQLAMEGRSQMLKTIFGGGKEDKPTPTTYRDFQEFAKAHNEARAARREKEAAKAEAKAPPAPKKK